MVVTIGIDPHKGSHTAVAVDEHEATVGQLRVRSGPDQLARLCEWAQAWPLRTWAVENASGLGYLLSQQLVDAGERVVDVPPKLAARARLLDNGDVNKNDPNDARSVAVAALRAKRLSEVAKEGHAAVMRLWARRRKDLTSARTRVANRLHAVILELVPGGYAGEIYAAKVERLLEAFEPAGAVAAARKELAEELLGDLRRFDGQLVGWSESRWSGG
jgi:transposase